MSATSTHFRGKVAVVTGAGSGIGRALAVDLAGRGARLALSDVDPTGLAETVRQAEALGAEVRTDHLDVGEREAVFAYAEAVQEQFAAVNIVFNNAGISFSGEVEVSEFKDMERIMDVDYWGVVNGTKAFLPHLIASGDGHVVNTSSLFGLLAMPSQSAYNAAKFAVRGFTESLRQEMLIDGRPVKVSCVHPGGIKTNIVRNGTAAAGTDNAAVAALFDAKLARTTATEAARVILRGVEKGHARILVGADAKVLDVLVRITGSGYQRVITAVAPRIMPRRTSGL
ncbi:SDR family oxidoreductase [Rhodococcus antarcticus]|uniref:SDR family oxidoreductase n=1 Tax=Rhodococcus antarcticus TaxID=2987751 RepID=A0ABY6P1W7_9NOCA|nr:SDR family oxidoreductase [Rhodococcus antarcticus]UZJ25271.1 SDR family oxidoreductase [Rhodococcus antarcticus]